jgi:hypothetical protein
LLLSDGRNARRDGQEALEQKHDHASARWTEHLSCAVSSPADSPATARVLAAHSTRGASSVGVVRTNACPGSWSVRIVRCRKRPCMAEMSLVHLNLVLVELLVPVPLRAPPVARSAPSSTPLRCWSISLGRSASCIPFPSFSSHPHTAARVHLAHSPPSNCCTSYTRSLTIIYCLDIFPFSHSPAADPLQDTRKRTLSHLDETRCLPHPDAVPSLPNAFLSFGTYKSVASVACSPLRVHCYMESTPALFDRKATLCLHVSAFHQHRLLTSAVTGYVVMSAFFSYSCFGNYQAVPAAPLANAACQ